MPPVDPDDSRLTAYALGELDPTEAAAVAALLAHDADTRREVDEIQATARLLADALATEPSPGLAPRHRRAIEGRLRPAATGRILLALAGLSTAAAALLAVTASLPRSAPKPKPVGEVALATARPAANLGDRPGIAGGLAPADQPEPAGAKALATDAEVAARGGAATIDFFAKQGPLDRVAPAGPPTYALKPGRPTPAPAGNGPAGGFGGMGGAAGRGDLARADQGRPDWFFESDRAKDRAGRGLVPAQRPSGAPARSAPASVVPAAPAPVVAGASPMPALRSELGATPARRESEVSRGRSAGSQAPAAALAGTPPPPAAEPAGRDLAKLGDSNSMAAVTSDQPRTGTARGEKAQLRAAAPQPGQKGPSAGQSAQQGGLAQGQPGAQAAQYGLRFAYRGQDGQQPAQPAAAPTTAHRKRLATETGRGEAILREQARANRLIRNGQTEAEALQAEKAPEVKQRVEPAAPLSQAEAQTTILSLKKADPLQEAPPAAPAPPEADKREEVFGGPAVDNPFIPTAQDQRSTFSIDVDTASYANVRRYLVQGGRPPREAVRIEELINYFPYDYAPPTGDDPFAIHIEVARCPWSGDHRLARIGLKGKEVAADKRPPANLVFLLDVSGSMNAPNKLPLVKDAMKLLVGRMTENDRVAIVVYAGRSGLALPSTNGTQKGEVLSVIDQLQAGGSTHGSEGIQQAYQVATAAGNFLKDGTNRVILCTDGDFNVGITDDAALEAFIAEKRKSGVFLSVLGFGEGNLKDKKMEALADKGNGNYHYIDSEREARKVLIEELSGTLVTIAKDVKIQVEFNPARVESFRLIGYENRLLAHRDFHDDTKDAGEIGAGHTVTALYEVIPAARGVAVAADEGLKYRRRVVADDGRESGELLTVSLRYKPADGDVSKKVERAVVDAGKDFSAATADFRFAAAVAAFGMILRESPHRGTATLAGVLELAEPNLGKDPSGYRKEFLDLVRRARAIWGE